MTRSAIVTRPIDAAAVIAEVSENRFGAISLFLGTVRESNEGRPVHGIEYSAYTEMAEDELARITTEARELFDLDSLVVEHRVGSLSLGEVSVAIAAAHAHRTPAIDCTRYVIEQIKKRVPVWKLELYADGTREWIDPTHSKAVTEA